MCGAGGSSKSQLRVAERGRSPADSRVRGKVGPGLGVWGAAVLTERPQGDRVETCSCREGEVVRAAPRREVTPGAEPGVGHCAIRSGWGEGPGRRLEGVEPGALTVRAERGGQGPEAEKEMLSQAGDRRAVGTHKRKVLTIPGKSAPRRIATGGAGDRRCKARPLAEISLSGNEESGLVGVWGGTEGRGLSQAGTLALGARVNW